MNNDDRKKMPCRSIPKQLLLFTVAGLMLTITGCKEPDPPGQPQIPGECYATLQPRGVGSNYDLYECTQPYVFLKDAEGKTSYEFLPYSRRTRYYCFDSGPMQGLCQKIQTISDPLGMRPGNLDFSLNELNTVRNQLMQKYFSPTKSEPIYLPSNNRPDPFDDVSDEDGLHPTFLRLLANDPKIKLRRREFAGGKDPFLNGHLFCKHEVKLNDPNTNAEISVNMKHPYATLNEDGKSFTKPKSNYSDREVEGQFFESTEDQLSSTLVEVARKVRLRLVDVK